MVLNLVQLFGIVIFLLLLLLFVCLFVHLFIFSLSIREAADWTEPNRVKQEAEATKLFPDLFEYKKSRARSL